MRKGRTVPNLVGQTIDGGHLAVTQLLGSGSNGVVFLAEDTASPSTHTYYYAVKVMAKALYGTRRFENQRQEIQNHMALSDLPGIVTLHRVIEDCRFYYMIMDYHPGGDLFNFLTRGGVARGDNAHIKSIMVQIIEAVQDIHRRGIYHRDIKPENILISSDGTRVFLSDFGLSTTQSISITFGCGSKYHMSPECLGTCGVDPAYSTRANDVWALGIILISIITGHNPWHQAVEADVCYRAYIRDPMFLRNSLPISSEALDVLKRIFAPAHDRVTLDFLRLYVIGVDKFYDLIKPAPPRRLFFRKRCAPSPSPPPHSYIGGALDTIPRVDPTNEYAASASDAGSNGPRTPDMMDELRGLPSLSQLPDYVGGPDDMLVVADNVQAPPLFRAFFKRMTGKPGI